MTLEEVLAYLAEQVRSRQQLLRTPNKTVGQALPDVESR